MAAASAPTVSVIMPVYNREAYVAAAMESVLAQSFADLELIVVDDGSTDRTVEVVGGSADPRLRLVRRDHAGISAAMNAGLRAARGFLVARLDSDDVWLPDLLATQVAALEAQPEVGFVYARGQAMSADGRPLRLILGRPPRYPASGLRSLLFEDCTCNITVVARRECFTSAGPFDETFAVNEDWDMWLRMAVHHRFSFTDAVLARFRQHESNTTHPRSAHFDAGLEGRVAVLDKFFAAHPPTPEIESVRAEAYINVYLGAGRSRLALRQLGPALIAFRTAIHLSPRPLATAGRTLWLIASQEILQRFDLGLRFLDWQAAIRRRWRSR